MCIRYLLWNFENFENFRLKEPKELSPEEQKSILESQSFLDFFGKSTRYNVYTNINFYTFINMNLNLSLQDDWESS